MTLCIAARPAKATLPNFPSVYLKEKFKRSTGDECYICLMSSGGQKTPTGPNPQSATDGFGGLKTAPSTFVSPFFYVRSVTDKSQANLALKDIKVEVMGHKCSIPTLTNAKRIRINDELTVAPPLPASVEKAVAAPPKATATPPKAAAAPPKAAAAPSKAAAAPPKAPPKAPPTAPLKRAAEAPPKHGKTARR